MGTTDGSEGQYDSKQHAARRNRAHRQCLIATHHEAFFFDDAYRGLREHAFPVLEAHGFGAVCSVITDYAGRLNRWDVAYGGRRFAHLAWQIHGLHGEHDAKSGEAASGAA